MLCLAGLCGCLMADAFREDDHWHAVVPGPAARKVQEAAGRVLDQWAREVKEREGVNSAHVDQVKVTVYTQVIPDLGFLIGERFRVAKLEKQDGKAIEKGNYEQVANQVTLFIDALDYLGCLEIGLSVSRGCFSNSYYLTGFWNGKTPDPEEARHRDQLEDRYDNL